MFEEALKAAGYGVHKAALAFARKAVVGFLTLLVIVRHILLNSTSATVFTQNALHNGKRWWKVSQFDVRLFNHTDNFLVFLLDASSSKRLREIPPLPN